jgi:predicted ArsR family transcriptional regulator
MEVSRTQRPSTESQLAATALLAEPVRRTLYLFVVRQAEAVSRDQAAEAAGIERSLAAFHLDKLVEAGLLEATYRRLHGRTGPGAGRPSKLYRRSAVEIDVNVPERRYQLLAQLLAGAVGSSGEATTALAAAARQLGESLGTEARTEAGPRPDREQLLASAERVLDRMGFQPFREDAGTIRMRNCPFDALAKDHRDLVCRMNVELMDGVLGGLRTKGIEASLEPQAQTCCVALRRSRS